MTSIAYIKQREAYLKAFYLHQSGCIDDAILFYSQSLTVGGEKFSDSRLRLEALEAIELIVSEKRALK